MAPGRRPRSVSRECNTPPPEQHDPSALAAQRAIAKAATEEKERAAAQISENLPREVLLMGRRFDQHQLESNASFTALQGEISKLASMMVSGFASLQAPPQSTDASRPQFSTPSMNNSRPFSTPPPPHTHPLYSCIYSQ